MLAVTILSRCNSFFILQDSNITFSLKLHKYAMPFSYFQFTIMHMFEDSSHLSSVELIFTTLLLRTKIQGENSEFSISLQRSPRLTPKGLPYPSREGCEQVPCVSREVEVWLSHVLPAYCVVWFPTCKGPLEMNFLPLSPFLQSWSCSLFPTAGEQSIAHEQNYQYFRTSHRETGLTFGMSLPLLGLWFPQLANV